MGFKLCLPAVAALSLASAATAQSPVQRTTLQQQPFPSPTYQTVTVRTVIDRGGEVGPHTHPGLEMAYVLAGQGTVRVKGAAPKQLAAGASFAMPEGTVHSVHNTGAEPLVLLSTYVVEKAKPIASAAH